MDIIDIGHRVSWKPEFEARRFGIVTQRDHLRSGGDKYIVRDLEDGSAHYLSNVTKEVG